MLSVILRNVVLSVILRNVVLSVILTIGVMLNVFILSLLKLMSLCQMSSCWVLLPQMYASSLYPGFNGNFKMIYNGSHSQERFIYKMFK